MSKINYIVKDGEQLLSIAVEKKLNYTSLLRFNPSFQSAPFSIKPGQSIVLPSEAVETKLPLEENVKQVIQTIATNIEGCISTPAFAVYDILMLTGDKSENYFLLDKRSQEEVLEEASILDALSNEYSVIAKTTINDDESFNNVFLAKEAWFKKAVRVGLFDFDGVEGKREVLSDILNSDVIKDKLTTLEQRQTLFEEYYRKCQEDGYLHVNNFDSSKPLWDEFFDTLNQNLTYFNELQEKDITNESKTTTLIPSVLDNNKVADLTLEIKEYGLVEVLLVSQNQRLYVRPDFINERKKQWKTSLLPIDFKSPLGDKKSMSLVFFNEIKNNKFAINSHERIDALATLWDTNNVGEFKYKEWLFTENLNEKIAQGGVAVSPEAQLLRFCLNDKNIPTELIKSQIDLFVSNETTVSLVEGEVTVEKYFPYETGMPISFYYRDNNGLDVLHPFGRFRSNLNIELRCFSEDQKEQGSYSGIRSIFGARAEVGISAMKAGSIGLKSAALSKDYIGGQVVGSLEWFSPQSVTANDFSSLLFLKKEGNVALTSEFLGGFQLAFEKGSLIFYCKGELLLGECGNGGVGVIVEPEKNWSLVLLVWEILQVIGYRYIYCITDAAYQYFSQCAYYFFVSDSSDLRKAIDVKGDVLETWLEFRNENINSLPFRAQEAQNIANKILSGKDIYSGCNVNLLPPETIGMLLDTLISTFSFSLARNQEIAVQYLLRKSVAKSWRKLEEILMHMSVAGDKLVNEDAVFYSLARIHNILDNNQIIDFNSWLRWVAEGEDEFTTEGSPFILTKNQKTFENKLLSR